MAGLDFVDSIAASPTVRLALSDGTTWNVLEGTEFPPPPLEQAIASTLLTDGAVIPSSVYGLRRITLDLGLGTGSSTADQVATAVQALHRQLDRPGGNILRLNEFTTNPIFFRTFRASASSVTFRMPSDGTKKRITVDLLAEPFGLGLQETPVSSVTVQTDPASGAGNACFVDVTGVKGDVETPAFIRWPSAHIAAGQPAVFAVRRRGTPSAAPFLFQAEALTQGTDTTTQPNDGNFSGAGNNYSRTTFATAAAMTTRVSTLDLGTASVDLRGRYRVFLRYRKNTSGDGINLQLLWGDEFIQTILNDTFATPNTTTIKTADLGEISVPVGFDPVFDPAGIELAVSDSFRLAVRAERTSGSGTLDLDFIVLVPADDRLAYVQWRDDSASGSDHWMLDAATNNSHARTSGGLVYSASPPQTAGGLPMLSPNQTNRVYMLRQIPSDTSAESWTLTPAVNPVSVSYWPRYLTVRPAST